MSGAGTSTAGPRNPCLGRFRRDLEVLVYLVELLSKSASDSLKFSDGVSLGVESDTGLSATEWDVASGALPGHESGKSLDLVHVDVGRVSHTTLGWEAVVRVLSSVAGENLV